MNKNSGCDHIFEVKVVESPDNRFIGYFREYVIRNKAEVLVDRLIRGKCS